MALSSLGIFHTAIGVIAIIAAIISFVRYGKIDLARLAGKIYFYGTVVTALAALGLTKHGFNAGHIFSIFIFVLVLAAFIIHTKNKGNNKLRYVETFLLSFSFLLSLVPTVNETFTRVPVGHPLATSPADPLIAKTLLALLVLFVVGSALQFAKQRKVNRMVL